MVTVGIDLASQPQTTAAVSIEWRTGVARVTEMVTPCTDRQIDELVAHATAVGIDAPFGWPDEFTSAVRAWQFEVWSPAIRDRMRFRHTDRVVLQRLKKTPLSVSTDAISLPAMRAMSLLRRHRVADRSGDGKFFEVYPAATLLSWGMPGSGYKDSKKAVCQETRKQIVHGLTARMPWLELPDTITKSPDLLDAVLAALTARAANQCRTVLPPDSLRDSATREGWIHIPTGLPSPDL